MPIRVTEIPLIDRLFLLGPPGIGKTEIIKQLSEEEARKKGKIFVDLRKAKDEVLDNILENPSKYFVYYRIIATHVFPEELGVPRINGNPGKEYVEFLPPKILKVLSLDEIEGVLFIDEITNVQRDDQLAMLYSLLQEKEASWLLKLPDSIKIIAAGNPMEWSRIVQPLPEPLINRIIKYEVVEPTPEEWFNYMERRFGDRWEKLVYAYLRLFPDDMLKPPTGEDMQAFPTPRSWTNLAVTLYHLRQAGASPAVIEETVVGGVGREVASKLLPLLRTNINVQAKLEAVKADPSEFDKCTLEEKVLVLHALSQRKVVEMLEYKKFIKYLSAKHREFLMLLAMLMPKEKRVEFTKAFLTILRDALNPIIRYIM